MSEQTPPKKSKKRRLPAWAIALVACGSVVVFAIGILPAIHEYRTTRFRRSYALSAEQMQAVGKAIGEYETANGERPMKLAQLVEAKLIEPAELFDDRRDDVPVTIGKFAASETNPDVLYFPALRASDPADNVLLCTLLLRNRNDKYRVIYNDGSLGQLESMELVIALNRTYEYIGGQLQPAKEDE